jgi:ATP-dependent DNA helicase PIF1
MKRKVSNKSMKALESQHESIKSLQNANTLDRYFPLPNSIASSEKKNLSIFHGDKAKVVTQDNGLHTTSDVVDPEKPEKPPEEKIDIYKTITLSNSQMKVLQAIADGKSVFFTGAAGSGKSFILRILQDLFNLAHQRENIAFTAPTGVAACNIGGRTINSWAGIGLCDKQLEQVIAR